MSETKKVITVADRSTKALVVATAGLAKIAGDLQALAQSSVLLGDEIEFKQSQLGDIQNQIDSQFREQTADLRLRVLENEEQVLNELLQARGLVRLSNEGLLELKSDLAAAVLDNEAEVKRAVDAAVSSTTAGFRQQLLQKESDHRVAIAELNANSAAKDNRIEFLEKQNESLQESIKAERDTRLEIAKADAGRQGVVVNAGGK